MAYSPSLFLRNNVAREPLGFGLFLVALALVAAGGVGRAGVAGGPGMMTGMSCWPKGGELGGKLLTWVKGPGGKTGG